MIRALLIALALTGPASAGAWEEFERRCLVPMENVEAAVLTGLIPTDSADEHHPDAGVYLDPLGQFSIVSEADGEGQRICGIVLENSSEPFLEGTVDEANAWVEALEINLQYDLTKDWSHGKTYLSTDWREPRIEVVFHVPVYRNAVTGRRTSTFLVRETDLES